MWYYHRWMHICTICIHVHIGLIIDWKELYFDVGSFGVTFMGVLLEKIIWISFSFLAFWYFWVELLASFFVDVPRQQLVKVLHCLVVPCTTVWHNCGLILPIFFLILFCIGSFLSSGNFSWSLFWRYPTCDFSSFISTQWARDEQRATTFGSRSHSPPTSSDRSKFDIHCLIIGHRNCTGLYLQHVWEKNLAFIILEFPIQTKYITCSGWNQMLNTFFFFFLWQNSRSIFL